MLQATFCSSETAFLFNSISGSGWWLNSPLLVGSRVWGTKKKAPSRNIVTNMFWFSGKQQILTDISSPSLYSQDCCKNQHQTSGAGPGPRKAGAKRKIYFGEWEGKRWRENKVILLLEKEKGEESRRGYCVCLTIILLQMWCTATVC